MALDMSHSRSKGKKDESHEVDEMAEMRRQRRLELWGLLVICGMVVYMLALQRSLGRVGIGIYFISITLLGKVGAYVIPLGLVLLAASLLLARRNKAVDGLWKFFLIAAPATSCVIDILLHNRPVYLESEVIRDVGYLGIYLSGFFRNAFGTEGSVWIIGALMFILFIALTGFSVTGVGNASRKFYARYRERSKIRALTRGVKAAASKAVGEPDDEPDEIRVVDNTSARAADYELKEQMSLGLAGEASAKEEKKPRIEDTPTDAPKQRKKRRKYKLPPLTLLNPSPKQVDAAEEQRDAAECIIRTLETYGVKAEVTDIIRGPRVTRVEVGIGEGTRLYKIEALADEIAYALPAKSVRVEAPIPGKRAVGIEFPNRRPVVVNLREMLADDQFRKHPSLLYMAIAKDLGGQAVYADLSTMPHFLIAGQTGSGKSVCLNACIISLVYRANPDEVKLILIDPKLVEMAAYEGLPHLLTEVVNDVNDALNALRWAVEEMRERYKKLKKARVNNLADYNRQIEDESDRLPYIVIVVDEMADLMNTEPVEMERLIASLTRLARAVGIHLVLATQRPDVKVITGGIKANVPARCAFALPSQHDSRTVLNSKGAEKLLSNGDMLFQPIGESKPIRAQGALVKSEEIDRVVSFWVEQGDPDYDEDVVRDRAPEKGGFLGKGREVSEEDQRYLDEAIKVIWTEGEASVSLLQRKLGVGYPKAGRLMEYIEELGLVGPKAGSKPRQITFDETHPALKLFDDDDGCKHGDSYDMPAARRASKRDKDDDDDFIPPVDSLGGDMAAGEISGI